MNANDCGRSVNIPIKEYNIILIKQYKKMVLSTDTNLYRYNLSDKMPDVWSTEYKSPEYHYDIYGDKNQIGAFFFYIKEGTAKEVLNVAISDANKRGESYSKCTITHCKTTRDINILDLTGCTNPINILNKLYDENIDVLTKDFSLFVDNKSFEMIRKDYDFLIKNDTKLDCKKRMHYADKINKFFCYKVNLLCQRLTDFGNGKPFKKLLTEKGYEGYQFNEESSSPTICLFDSNKLTSPIHTNV